MEVNAIANAIGLPARSVRYVLEHRVLPGTQRASRGPRVPRSFTDLEAFGIACAAVMIDAGLRRNVVAETLSQLTKSTTRSGRQIIPLLDVFNSTGPVALSVGDGVNLRIDGPPRAKYTTPWLQAATGAAVAKAYEPRVAVTIDLAGIRDVIKRVNRP